MTLWHEHAERIDRQVAAPEPGEHYSFPGPLTSPTLSMVHLPPHSPRVMRVEVDLRDVVTYRGNTITVNRGGEVVRG